MKVSVREAGSKKKFAEAFIEQLWGECTIHQYRAAAEADPDYHGNMLGSEFYQAANKWRAERGLCKLSEISLPANQAAKVSHGWVWGPEVPYGPDRSGGQLLESLRDLWDSDDNLGQGTEMPDHHKEKKEDTWKSVLRQLIREAQSIESVLIRKDGSRTHVEFDFTTD